MTLRQATYCLAMTTVVALLCIVLAAKHTGSTRSAAESAHLTHTQVRADAERVLALRGQSQTVAIGAQPQGDAFQRLNATLAACGLTSTRIESVTPSGDRALPRESGLSARRLQSFRVVLSPIRLDELGTFLDRWRREHHLWVVAGVDLVPVSNRREQTDARFRATLTASAVYVDQASTDAREEQTP